MFRDLGATARTIARVLPSPEEMETLFDALWPINRSLAGPGFRASLDIVASIMPMEVSSFSTGSKVFDWTVPPEWEVHGAWLEHESGDRIVDFAWSNLHVVGYSVPVDSWLTLDELQPHLHSLPESPHAIPYVTSYYERRWGFCLTHAVRERLKRGRYRAVIQSTLRDGHLNVGHCMLWATDQLSAREEVLLTSYLCHPSLANNELSGPIVLAMLYRALASLPTRRFTYRFVIGPETIGAIAYLSKFGERLKAYCRAGLVATCCGLDRPFIYKKPAATHDVTTTKFNGIVRNVLRGVPHEIIAFNPSGSDERQYNAPGFKLPVGSLMRGMYGTYPEYHTSSDDKHIISFRAMRETVEMYLRICLSLEANGIWLNTHPYGEPHLSPRGLYPSLGVRDVDQTVERMMWILALADGGHDLLTTAERAECSMLDMAELVRILENANLLRRVC